jgi:accessory gene regulator protein AgrB
MEVRDRMVELTKRRKRRMMIGSLLVAFSLILMEVAILILLGVLDVNAATAIALIVISPTSMAMGIYLTFTNPPIMVE